MPSRTSLVVQGNASQPLSSVNTANTISALDSTSTTTMGPGGGLSLVGGDVLLPGVAQGMPSLLVTVGADTDVRPIVRTSFAKN